MDAGIYNTYVDILKEELVPAMGCTEPIAIAYATALARDTLGALPEAICLTVSDSIIKNVKSVIVPNTGGRKGLRVATAAGALYGDAARELQVLSGAGEERFSELDGYMSATEISVLESDAKCAFDLQVTVRAGQDEAYVRIIGHHTNVVEVRRNGKDIVSKPFTDEQVPVPENRRLLSIENIVRFADEVNIADVQDVLQRQIDYNMAIADAGIYGKYGASVGKILLRSYGNSVQNRAKAWAAAGSDARMNGCELPVIINSGSGNQGMTCSIPVIIYARECNVSRDMMMRALVVSNLVTIHLKTGIGSLSAYCGATSAGAGSGAGICYLYGGRYEEIARTVVNALAINSGMICDGAKASCAAKIASAVEAGLLGMQMNLHGSEFVGGDGIVIEGVENTIRAVSAIASEGMKATDSKIIDIMMKNG